MRILNLGKVVETTIEFPKDKVRGAFDSRQLCPTCAGVNPLPDPCGSGKKAKVVIRSSPSELPDAVRSLGRLMDSENAANPDIEVAVRSPGGGGDRLEIDPVPTPCKK
jgi:hypothetical protein